MAKPKSHILITAAMQAKQGVRDVDIRAVKYLEERLDAGEMTRQEVISENTSPSPLWRR
jgi:hypothetical protein